MLNINEKNLVVVIVVVVSRHCFSFFSFFWGGQTRVSTLR
jgi:hypothetical protein